MSPAPANIGYDRARIAGVVLAGGRSRRMGGGDKALKLLAGRPMAARIADRLSPQVGAAVLVVNGDPSAFSGFGLPVIGDAYGDHAGPLAGLLSGMIWARDHCPAADWVATTPCDTPFLPQTYVAALREAAGGEAGAVIIAASGGRTHFASGLWPLALHEDLAACLAAGERRMESWIRRHPNRTVAFAPAVLAARSIDPFFNVNTPEDYAMAEALTQEMPS